MRRRRDFASLPTFLIFMLVKTPCSLIFASYFLLSALR